MKTPSLEPLTPEQTEAFRSRSYTLANCGVFYVRGLIEADETDTPEGAAFRRGLVEGSIPSPLTRPLASDLNPELDLASQLDWLCACGWKGEARDLKAHAQSGHKVCPSCGASGGLASKWKEGSIPSP